MKRSTHFSLASLATATTLLGFSGQAFAGSVTLSATTFGNYSNTGTRTTTTYLTGKNNTAAGTADTNRSFFVFNIPAEMSATYRTITSSTINLFNPTGGFTAPAARTLNITNVTCTTTTCTGTQIFTDLGTTGTGNSVYGSTSVSSTSNNATVSVNLGNNANADIKSAANSSLTVGGALTGITNTTASTQRIFSGSTSAGTKQLVINFADAQAATNGNQQFGNVLIGQSKSVDITISNSGETGSLLSGSIGPSTNSLISPTSGSQSFTNLGAGQSATRTYTFTPTQRSNGNPAQTTIALTSNTKNAISNPLLTGSGVAAQNSITSTNNNAGYVRIGTQANLGLNLQNVGDGNLSGLGAISNLNGTASLSGSSDFSAVSGSLGALSLGDNVAQAINLIYKPTTHGANTGVVTLGFTNGSDNGRNQAQVKTVDFTGYGVGAQYSSSIAPGSTIDFGQVPIGTPSIFSLVVSNTTTDPTNQASLTGLTLLNAFFDGVNTNAFTLLNFTPGTVLLPGESLTLQIQFLSADPRDFSGASLRILTDQNAAFGQLGDSFSYNIIASAIPEPSNSSALLGIGGLVALVSVAKRKRQ